MIDPKHPIAKLLREDQRYAFEAYVFVFEALRYAQEELGMGAERPELDPPAGSIQDPGGGMAAGKTERPQATRHLTGQELCEAIRRFALEQFGYMAKCVLNHWGVKATSDFGEIVFNLIRIDEMRKTPNDRREDFNDVFDFDQGLTGQFKIEISE